MSRCFPFPPPGYERKAGANSVDVFKQDKRREKKHKKEKRDKEKREGKEKKEKDHGDEKHRDKKEKKDKRRDKKDKDKEKEKDRSSTSNEKNEPVQVGRINQDKIFDQKGAPPLQAGEKFTQKEKIRNSIADTKRPSITFGGQNGETVVSTNHVSARVSDANCIHELAKRLRNDQCSITEQASATPDWKKNDVKDHLLSKDAGAGLEGKERGKDRRRNNEKKIVERVIKEQTGINGTVKVQNSREAHGPTKLQKIAKPSEVSIGEMEWREIMTGREGDDKQGEKLKDQTIDKSKGKVKELRKKKERSKQKSEQKHSDQEKSKAGNKNGVLGSPHLNILHPVKEPNSTVAAEWNPKKRKAETNGFLLGDEVRANKLHKHTQVFQPSVENGMETHQISTKTTPSRTDPFNNVKVNKVENKVNGVKGVAVHTSPISPLHHPLSSAAEAELLLSEEASSSVKPPHPDSMFLGEILKVPKLDELADLDDDQGWLFSSNKKDLNGGQTSLMFEGTPKEVWGESIHIESADIYALPYVFPY